MEVTLFQNNPKLLFQENYQLNIRQIQNNTKVKYEQVEICR